MLERVGNTPLLRLERVGGAYPGAGFYAKAEWFNPGGSVKDRAALNMIREGERSGALRPGKTILDATSGNTGIAYAMIGAALGYPVKLCLPANASRERKRILTAYGAEVGADAGGRGLRRRHPPRPRDLRCCAGRVFLSRPVQQSGELAGALPDHGAGNLGADRRAHHAFRRRPGHQRHVRGHGAAPEGVESGDPLHQPAAGLGVSRTRGLEAHGQRDGAADLRSGGGGRGKTMVRTEDAYRMVKRLAREEGMLVSPSAAAALVGCMQVAASLRREQNAP